MAKGSMKFKLKYGQSELELTQSETLIGIRPKRASGDVAEQAVQREFGQTGWRDAGIIGGFRIIAIEDAEKDVDEALDHLRMDGAVEVGTHIFEVGEGGGIYVPTGDLFIEFKPDTSKEDQEAVLDEYRLIIKEARENHCFIVSVTRSSPNPIKVAAGLQAQAIVNIAEPDLATKREVKGIGKRADWLLDEQWHLQNTGFHRGTTVGFVAGADARVVDAWQQAGTYGSSHVVVAVIDDGFDLQHPDLSAPGKIVHPWDFTRQTNDPSPGSGDWHGTACAGVVVGAYGGGGILGAAPDASLMPVRWGPYLSDHEIEAWFGYVSRMGAAVVSNSWGAANPYFPLSTRAFRAIEDCAKNGRGGLGCVIVFAAGNSNRDINDPANGTIDGFAIHPDVIAVSASTSRDERSDYSNFGNEISVCAPSNGAGGWGILTSDVTGRLGYSKGDYTYDFGGTSSACPLVAGVAGLVLSLNPQLTSAEVRELLETTTRKIGSPGDYDANGHSRWFGYGCINAAAATGEVLNRLGTHSPIVAKKHKKKKQTAKAHAALHW